MADKLARFDGGVFGFSSVNKGQKPLSHLSTLQRELVAGKTKITDTKLGRETAAASENSTQPRHSEEKKYFRLGLPVFEAGSRFEKGITSEHAFFRLECEDYTNMKWFMHPLLEIIAGATEPELAKYIEYLKVENQILRDRLPKKIDTTEAEREKLLKVGKHLGGKIKQLVSIVSPRTFQRWVQADAEARAAKKENE